MSNVPNMRRTHLFFLSWCAANLLLDACPKLCLLPWRPKHVWEELSPIVFITQSPTRRFTGVYLEFSLKTVTWTPIAKAVVCVHCVAGAVPLSKRIPLCSPAAHQQRVYKSVRVERQPAAPMLDRLSTASGCPARWLHVTGVLRLSVFLGFFWFHSAPFLGNHNTTVALGTSFFGTIGSLFGMSGRTGPILIYSPVSEPVMSFDWKCHRCWFLNWLWTLHVRVPSIVWYGA